MYLSKYECTNNFLFDYKHATAKSHLAALLIPSLKLCLCTVEERLGGSLGADGK